MWTFFFSCTAGNIVLEDVGSIALKDTSSLYYDSENTNSETSDEIIEASQPASEPSQSTQPSNEPAQPASEPSQPTSEPSQSTQPSNEPSQPTSEPSQPSRGIMRVKC